jgi:hypothetical protein
MLAHTHTPPHHPSKEQQQEQQQQQALLVLHLALSRNAAAAACPLLLPPTTSQRSYSSCSIDHCCGRARPFEILTLSRGGPLLSLLEPIWAFGECLVAGDFTWT